MSEPTEASQLANQVDPAKRRRQLSPEDEARIAEIMRRITEDLCPICGEKPERKKQVGRCVYAYPCGHRMYQGSVEAFNEQTNHA